MAKITAPSPKAPTTSAPDAPEVVIDYGELTQTISERQATVLKGEMIAEGGNIDCALDAIEFRQANPEAERTKIHFALAAGIAEPRGLKPDDIMKAPDKTLNAPTATPNQKEKFSRLNSAYTLVSKLMSVAWPKDPDAEKRVQKLLATGEKGFVKLCAAAAKKQKNPTTPQASEDTKITKDNFGTKLGLFLTKALLDTELDSATIVAMCDVAAEAWQTATDAPEPAKA